MSFIELFPGKKNKKIKRLKQGFPGGSAVKNPPLRAGDRGLTPDPERSRMLRSS